MAKKKTIGVKKRTPRKRAHRIAKRASEKLRQAQKSAPLLYEVPVSNYSEALLNNIVSNGGRHRVSEHSLLFNSVLSTITPGIRNLYYRSGVSVGRALFRIYQGKRHYLWYEESVADLVDFFESVGFKGVTYNVFPNKVELTFNNTANDYLGTEIHVFESGIMCGFLTAGKQQHVRVAESSCRSNGGRACHFVTSDSLPLYLDTNSHEVLNRFINSIKDPRKGNSNEGVAEEYYALSSSVFLEHEYAEHIRKIVYYMGNAIGSRLSPRPSKGSARLIELLFDSLNLGSLRVESVKPLKATISFDRLKAKKEFVDISIAFLHGLVRQAIDKNSVLDARISKANNSYVARVSESRR